MAFEKCRRGTQRCVLRTGPLAPNFVSRLSATICAAGGALYTTLARDQYVRVVYKGYLLPFGHRASLVKVTERHFLSHPKTNVVYAVLQQHSRPLLIFRGRLGMIDGQNLHS